MEQVASVQNNIVPPVKNPRRVLPLVLILLAAALILSGALVYSISKLGVFSSKKQVVEDTPISTPSVSVPQPALGKELTLKEASIQAREQLAKSLSVPLEKLIIGVTGNSGGFYVGTAKLSDTGSNYWWVAANKNGFLEILKNGEGKASCDDLTSINVPVDLLTDCN